MMAHEKLLRFRGFAKIYSSSFPRNGYQQQPLFTKSFVLMVRLAKPCVRVFTGKSMNGVEIKPEMVGHYLGEFSITYKPVRHGRPGIGSTNSSRFIPLN